MWSRLGREVADAPPGTYCWSDIREPNIHWNDPDPVLVGADLLDHFPVERFRILTAIPGPTGALPLVRETGRHWDIEFSDHLPFVFDLDLPPEVKNHG